MSSALDVGTHTTFQRQKIPTLHHLGAGNILGHFFDYISHNSKKVSGKGFIVLCVCPYKDRSVCDIS